MKITRYQAPEARSAGSSGSGVAPEPPRESSIESIRNEAADASRMARSWGLFSAFALIIALAALLGVAFGSDDDGGSTSATAAASPAPAVSQDHGSAGDGAIAAAPAADDPTAKAIDFEKFSLYDPNLPAVPSGEVKKFKVDVYEHVTQVSSDLAPTRVWSYAVNGTFNRGNGASAPIVVNEGDRVKVTLVNGSSEKMAVTFPHSLDFHSAEVAPNVDYTDIPPGGKKVIDFTAKHPGVYMYHCATKPVLHHTGAGMVGMMVVKPQGLAPVDRELAITQQEFYIGEPGGDADYAKMQAKAPDVIAFNGFANQYADNPIGVKRGEKVRMYVLNAGPSIWSAFHVIGTVFDKAVTDNGRMTDVQTINLAPSQGGYVEFTLDEEGTYPFVTHAFGDMEKGALGVLATEKGAAAGESGGH